MVLICFHRYDVIAVTVTNINYLLFYIVSHRASLSDYIYACFYGYIYHS